MTFWQLWIAWETSSHIGNAGTMSNVTCYAQADVAHAGNSSYLSSAEALWRSSVRRSSSTFSARACAVASASRARRPSPSLALAAAFSSAAACAKCPPNCLGCWGACHCPPVAWVARVLSVPSSLVTLIVGAVTASLQLGALLRPVACT